MKLYMQDFKEQPRYISLFPSNCETAMGHFSPDISPAEAMYVTKPCCNPHDYNIITCQSPNRQDFIDEVKGLKMDLSLSPIGMDNLACYIPSLTIETASLLSTNEEYPFLGITLKDIVASLTRRVAGGLREASEIRFRPLHQFDAFLKKPKLILFLTGTDTAIEYIWRERYKCVFFETIQKMNFLAAGGFNFSLFEGECAFSHALNQKRNLYSSYLLEQHGINSIPHVYALTTFQINRWIQ